MTISAQMTTTAWIVTVTVLPFLYLLGLKGFREVGYKMVSMKMNRGFLATL